MHLVSEELTIRDATEADAAQLGVWWRDGKVMAHAGFPLGLQITDERIAEDLATQSDATRRTLIIEVDGVPVGEMNYRNDGDGTADIGIKICDFRMQERGYGTRVLCLLIGSLFSDLGFRRITLDTNPLNLRAQHVYEKIGFRKVGVRVDSWTDQLGQLQSAVDYELTEQDFRAEIGFFVHPSRL